MSRLFTVLIFTLCVSNSFCQTLEDSIQIRKTALDYISSWDQGNQEQMKGSLHPMLHKQDVDGNILGTQQLVEYTGNCWGCHSDRFYADVQILDIEKLSQDDFLIASVKVVSNAFTDYLTITKTYGKYLITHALWSYNDKSATGSEKEVIKSTEEYYTALVKGNYDVFKERVTDSYCSAQAKCYFVLEKTDLTWMGKYFNEYTKQYSQADEPAIEVLDIHKGLMASVKVSHQDKLEFLHLVYSDGKWKVANVGRTFYMNLQELYLYGLAIKRENRAGDKVGVFDTRLHYNGDIKYYKLIEKSKGNDNDLFYIQGDSLYLSKNANEIKKWPLNIQIKAESAFSDLVVQDLTIDLKE